MNVEVVDFAKEMTTAPDGKFKLELPLKYFYQTQYTVTIIPTIAGTPVKQNFNKLFIPGETKRELEQKLDNGYILKLICSAK